MIFLSSTSAFCSPVAKATNSKKELRSEKKYLFDSYTKHFNINSIFYHTANEIARCVSSYLAILLALILP
ncbi:MAG: hypothetical protein ACI9VN_001714 [Patescibacteria group bacterium]|jgi:hypothetical protein